MSDDLPDPDTGPGAGDGRGIDSATLLRAVAGIEASLTVLECCFDLQRPREQLSVVELLFTWKRRLDAVTDAAAALIPTADDPA